MVLPSAVLPPYVQFIDITASNFWKAPLVRGGLRAFYATGTPPIEETAAQLAAARAAGMGYFLIDQTPGLHLFAAGIAQVADIEAFAGTVQAAAAAVAMRQTHTEQSTLYVSYSGLPGLKDAIKNPTGVYYGVADYGWSLAQSQQLLAQNKDWAYIQYGDNISNAWTLVPGTDVTCGQASCDIDVAKVWWAAQFLPKPPPPPPPPPHPALPKMEDDMQLNDGNGAFTEIPFPAGSAKGVVFLSDASAQGSEPVQLRVAVHSAAHGWNQIEATYSLPASGPVQLTFTHPDSNGLSVMRHPTGADVSVGYYLVP